MKSKTFLNVFLFTLFSSALSSYSSLAQCPKVDPTDEFEADRSVIFDGKKDCIRTNKRSIKILSPSETRKHILLPNPNSLYVANFHHHNRFWIAEIPYNFIEFVILQETIFQDLVVTNASHTQLRFKFKKDHEIQLFNQTQLKAKSELKLSDLILSIEAVAHENGPDYGLIDSMKNPFVNEDAPFNIASRVQSLEDTFAEEILQYNRVIKQFLLNDKIISPKKLLLKSILKFHKNFNMKEKYDLLFKNCTTELFIPIDAEIKWVNNFYDRILVTHPALVSKALKQRNILFKQLVNLDKEYKDKK